MWQKEVVRENFHSSERHQIGRELAHPTYTRLLPHELIWKVKEGEWKNKPKSIKQNQNAFFYFNRIDKKKDKISFIFKHKMTQRTMTLVKSIFNMKSHIKWFLSFNHLIKETPTMALRFRLRLLRHSTSTHLIQSITSTSPQSPNLTQTRYP